MRRLMLLARIDARRPAAWLSLVVATVAAWLLPEATAVCRPAPAILAMMVGVTVGVMAAGDAAQLVRGAGIDRGWCAERAAWPLIGWGLSMGLRGEGLLLGCGCLGIVVAAGLVAALVRCAVLAADAASATLATACCGGALGWWLDHLMPARKPGAVVALGVAVGVLVGVAGAARPSAILRSGMRGFLTAAAMTAAVAGMVGWLFLAPEFACLDLAASLALFTAMAVPAATLGDGVSQSIAWRRLERTMPRPRFGLGPGRGRDAVVAGLTPAALLGWPPLVAAALAGGDVGRSWPAAGVALGLVGAAGMLLVIVAVGELAVVHPDAVQAAALGTACLVGLAIVTARPQGPPAPLPRPGSAAVATSN